MSNSSADRIVQDLRRWLATAHPGDRLPSSRELRERFGVSPVTVQQAMRTLDTLGLVDRRPGHGTFARSPRRERSADYRWQTVPLGAQRAAPAVPATLGGAPEGSIGLHTGYPAAELLPESRVRQALARASRSTAAIHQPPVAGDPELRSWFARELGRESGTTAVTSQDTIITRGSQSALSSIFRSVVGAGNALLIESPTYWGALLAAKHAGVRLIPLPSGAGGPDPELIERALVESDAKAIYAQPNFANPTGIQWNADTRRGVLEAATAHNAFIIEDDWAHDFGIEATARTIASADPNGHVIYLRSLTKSVSPSLRVAAVIARGPVSARILADQGAESMYVSGILQRATLDVITQSGWDGHLRRMREVLRQRRDALVAALQQHAPQLHLEHLPQGGLNLWLRLPEHSDLGRFLATCRDRGVIVPPGDEWFPAEAPAPYVRLNFASAPAERFDEAARAIGGALPR